jgi:hypothetical protein
MNAKISVLQPPGKPEKKWVLSGFIVSLAFALIIRRLRQRLVSRKR